MAERPDETKSSAIALSQDTQGTSPSIQNAARDDGFAVPVLPASRLKVATPPEDPSGLAKRVEQAATNGTHRPQTPPPVPYEPPEWSAEPKEDFHFEVLKNGVIVHTTAAIRRAFLIVGRLPVCDIELEHTTISRYHAVVQFKGDGSSYIYDLGSTHGTFVNKVQIPKRIHHRIHVGDMIRFGQSTRLYIFQGPQEEDVQTEPVSTKRRDLEQDHEVTWGFNEDAAEDDEYDASTMPDDGGPLDDNAYYHADPKKALRVWLEQRGAELHFHVEEEGHGRNRGYVARVDLPIEIGIGTLSGIGRSTRKKVAENEAALDACLKLDRKGLLRTSGSEVRKAEKERLRKLLGEDDDDGDSFYDRTDRNSRKPKKGAADQKPETYESLMRKKNDISLQIEDVHQELRQAEAVAASADGSTGEDELDQFMSKVQSSIQAGDIDAIRRRLPPLEKALARTDRLLKMVQPTGMAMSLPMANVLDRGSGPSESVSSLPTSPVGVDHAVLFDAKTQNGEQDSARAVPEPLSNPAAKRKLPGAVARVGGDSSVVSKVDPTSKRRRVAGVLTAEQAEEHLQVESEAVVDWIAPGAADSDVADLNAAYGY
ncbi:Kanadaptin [Borealophlyctis nickersoniae]|nr:Kanadaptin [Borealophlyctis nickersoniae]